MFTMLHPDLSVEAFSVDFIHIMGIKDLAALSPTFYMGRSSLSPLVLDTVMA